MEKGVRIVTCFDEEYPPHFRARMGTAAPPALFFAGERALLDRPAVAVVGVSGVKTTPEVRQSIEGIVRGACELGYSVVTGGELGVSRVAASLVAELGVHAHRRARGGLLGHIGEEPMRGLIAEGRMAALSLEHPEALPTVPHAIARGQARILPGARAFIFNTDGKRGEADAIKRGLCDWVYAYTGYPATGPWCRAARSPSAASMPRNSSASAPVGKRPFRNNSICSIWNETRQSAPFRPGRLRM